MRFSPHGIAFDNGGDYRMLFFNSDGSVGEMCGNGARCICRYGFENGLADRPAAVPYTAQRPLPHAVGQQAGGGRRYL